MIRQRKNKGNKTVRPRTVSIRSDLNVPPAFSSQQINRQVFRYRGSSALSAVQIYRRNFFQLIGVGNGSTSISSLIYSFHINRITMYGSPPPNGSQPIEAISLTEIGPHGDYREKTASGTVANPAKLVWMPRPGTELSFWSSVNGAVLSDPILQFDSLSANTIIDLDISYVLQDGQVYTSTSASNVFGVLYTNALDNSTSSGSIGPALLVPIARVYIAFYG